MYAQIEPTGGEALGGVLAFLVIAGFYLLPAVVAAIRKVPNAGSVFVINLFLGWTVIGWVIALAMAARLTPPPPVHQTFTSQPLETSSPARPETSTAGRATLAYCPQCGTQAIPGHRFWAAVEPASLVKLASNT